MSRMLRGTLAVWMAWVAVTLPVRPSAAQINAVTRVGPRPAMILMLDTGESMDSSALTGAPQTCVAGGTCEMSRQLMIQEALIGEAEDAACVFYQGIPDQPPPDAPQQVCVADIPGYDAGSGDEGLLDIYADKVRFGLLVSDNVDDDKVGASGGFSYGETQTVTVDGETYRVRLGVRNYESRYGTMHGIGELGVKADLGEHNALIQAEIAEAVPFGAASVDALIEDAVVYKATEPSLQDGRGHASANACRAKRFVVITDGVGHPLFDGPESTNPHDPADAFEILSDAWTDVTVVPVSDVAQERLDRLEDMGIEVTEVADTVDELRGVLDSLVAEHLTGGDEVIESQTMVVSTVETRGETISDREIGQMQVGAAYSMTPGEGGADAVLRRGHLERLDFLCGDDEPSRSVDLANDPDLGLPAQRTRTVWTSIDGEVVALDPLVVSAEAMGVPEARHEDLVKWFHWEGSDRYPLADEDPRLGPVVRSTPAILAPPVLDLAFPGYQGPSENRNHYKALHEDRPTVALFGANDAMIHAFVLAQREGDSRARDARPELFAYIPSFFLHKTEVVANGGTGGSFLDAAPALRTVRLRNSAGVLPADEISQKLWADVLVGGAGPGGPYWYALDVSSVQRRQDGDSRPTLLWEFPGVDHRNVDSDALADLTGADGERVEATTYLGESWAKPAIGSVTLMEGAVRTERAAAFLPGGRSGGDADRGRSFYVVQLEKDPSLNGLPRVLRSFRTGLGNQTDDLVFPITGEPMVFLDAPGRQASRVFVGDAGGRLWRIDLGGVDPREGTMRMVHDAFEGMPLDSPLRKSVVLAPSLAETRGRELVVIYGTGDPGDLGGFKTHHRVWSLTERLRGDDEGQGRVFDEMEANWRIDLQRGEQMLGAPVIFDEVAYFTSFSKKGLSVCSRGEGRIWAVDFVGQPNEPELADRVVPRFATNSRQTRTEFVMDNPPLCSDSEEVVDPNAAGRSSLYCSLGSAISFGLEITYRPLCAEDFNDPAAGAAAGGRRPILSAQATGTAVGKPAGTSKQRSSGRSLTPQLRKKLPAPQNQPMPLSWGVVFE